MNITQFINMYYDVEYKGSNVKDNFEDVEEFLLGENPLSEGDKVVNAFIIDKFIRKDDVLLVQGIPGGKVIDKDKALQSACLLTDPTTVKGWDIGTVGDIMGHPFQQVANLEIQRRMQVTEFLFFPADKIIQKSRKACLIKTVVKGLALSDEIRDAVKDIDMIAAKTFQPRVKSSIEALKEARTVANRTFLLADTIHLKEEQEDSLSSSVPNPYSLADFRDFISDRNLVILFPKPAAALEIGSRQCEFSKRILDKARRQSEFNELFPETKEIVVK